MNTMQLHCFLTVAQTLNFAKAAEELNVTQPAVTQQIHALEEELNVTLFHRTTRVVELTRAGAIFLDDAKNVLTILERAKKRVADSFVDTRKDFTVGCHTHTEIPRFAEVLRRMRPEFPYLYPLFQVIPFQHLYQQLAEEHIDVVISFRERGLKKDLLYQELTQLPVLAVVPQEHDLAQRDTVQATDLANQKVIAIEPRRCPVPLGTVQYRVLETVSPLDIYLSDSPDSSVVLAKAGYGVAIIPDIFPFRDPHLAYLPIGDVEPMSYGLYYKKLAGRPELKAFVQHARDLLRSPSPSV